MTTKQLKTLQQILIQQKESLINKTDVFLDETRKGFQANGDEADLASCELNRTLSIRLNERERFLVQKIDRALEKIKEGSYGGCSSCGEKLTFDRLKARPVATLCIDCKLAQEREEQFYA